MIIRRNQCMRLASLHGNLMPPFWGKRSRCKEACVCDATLRGFMPLAGCNFIAANVLRYVGEISYVQRLDVAREAVSVSRTLNYFTHFNRRRHCLTVCRNSCNSTRGGPLQGARPPTGRTSRHMVAIHLQSAHRRFIQYSMIPRRGWIPSMKEICVIC